MTLFKNKIFWFLIVILTIAYCVIEAGGRGDFYIFMSAAGDLSLKRNIYELQYSVSYNYFYSVLFAIFLRLFYTLPFFWVKVYWLLINVFLFIHMFGMLSASEIVNRLKTRQKQIFLILVFVFSLRFFHENIHTSQITILILWCCVYGIYLIQGGKQVTGSAILALGINIKLLPIVFLPYLIYRGYFKAFIFTILFYVGSLFLPSLIIGHHYNMTLLKSWLALIDPFQQKHVVDVDERSFHGLSTLLATLLVKNVPDPYAMTIKRNIMDISLPAFAKVLLIVRMLLVSFTLYFLRWKPFTKPTTLIASLLEISYILLLIPLIFPHQQHYAFLFIVPAYSLVLLWLLLNFKTIPAAKRNLLICFLVLIYLVANLKILLGEFNNYYEHFKILTYASLLLIPLLIWVSRESGKRVI